jgi:hypothetical protein
MNTKDVILTLVVALALGGFFVWSSRSMMQLYNQQSLERAELCMKHGDQNNVPFEVCSHISSAADAAYSAAVSQLTPVVTMFLGLFLAFGLATGSRLRSVSNELEELKERFNA